MKPEHKIIVEVSTQSEWDTVTSFFGIKWDIDQRWSLYKERAAICPYDDNIGFPSCGNRDTIVDYLSKGYERLTHLEFEARFLNKNDIKDEEEFSIDVPEDLTDYYLCQYGITGRSLSQGHDTSGYIANIPLILPGENYEILRKEGSKLFIKLKQPPMNIENIITKAVEGLEQAASTLSKVQEMLKNRPEAEPEKKVWTVEAVYNEVKPAWMPTSYKPGHETSYRSFAEDRYQVPNEKTAEQSAAFCQLLTVAHWANGGEFVPILYKTTQQWEGYYLPFGFKTRSEYTKFLSVHGVEDLLKTFFGIEEDAK